MISPQPEAEKIMYEDAVKAYPDECCGFMFGQEDASGNRVISQVLPVFNSSGENKKRHFQIAPKDYMRAEQFALDKELQLLGIYHSHPDHPAEPSERDRESAQPWFSYVIISVSSQGVQRVRSWVLNEGAQFDEEKYIHQL